MKIRRLRVHNFRSILDADVEVHDYLMLVGANNAGKSNLLAALRAFYDDVKWSGEDAPKIGDDDGESWVELTYALTDAEWAGLAEKYKTGAEDRLLVLRRYFRSSKRVRPNQSNLYAILNDVPDNELFYGARNVGTAKIGCVIYIPALTTGSEQMKTTGPSPLRDMLHFMLKQVVSESEAYGEVEAAFAKLNAEARGVGGFLQEIVKPLNAAIGQWGIRFELSVNAVTPDDIIKNLVKPGFADDMLDDAVLALERYGQGFQRSFLYELMQLAPRFVERKKQQEKKEFDPNFTLILFEEPEAFLHPAQQENMAYHLRELGREEGRQVIVTSHSPIFVGKAADDLCRIVRIHREQGRSVVKQIAQNRLKEVLGTGLDFRRCLETYVGDVNIPDNQKKEARKLLSGVERDEELAVQEESFRYQLWLDSDRSSMFFADRVLLVEGPTEKALFSWLWAHDWHDLAKHRIAIVDVMGKYNFHRFVALLEAFGIPYGLMLDDDVDKQHHKAINEMIKHKSEPSRLSAPVFLEHCIEKFLGLPLPERGDRKPIQILKALEELAVPSKKLTELKRMVVNSLDLIDNAEQ